MHGRSIDQQLKIGEIGSGNLAVGILHRTGEHDTDGATEPGPDDVVGPTFSADSRNGTVREVLAGDEVNIPAGTLHTWLSIPDHVTYLGIRPDPAHVLPAGYVNPAMD
jgi:hypothetical protein